jgi:hypothetical protein
VPEGVDSYQRHSDSEEEGDGGDIERQRSHASNDGQSKQFEGIREVRKQMKWLFPAMGIGVRFVEAQLESVLTNIGPSGRSGSDNNCV